MATIQMPAGHESRKRNDHDHIETIDTIRTRSQGNDTEKKIIEAV